MMEDLCKRFPLLGKMVFENVDDENLVKFKESSREINNHLQNERYYWTRIIKKHGEYFKDFADSWKKVISKTPVETVKELASTVEGYFNFSDDIKPYILCRDSFTRCFGFPIFEQLHPLHVAAERGNLNLCQHIVEKTGDFNPASQLTEATALHFAAYQGHLEVYQWLLDNVDDKNPVDHLGRSPFFWAVRKNQVKFCRVIIKTVEEKNPANNINGSTALHEATANGYLEMRQLLIDNMTGDKNPGNFYGYTPLHLAASNGHFEICQLISQHLEDKNPRNVGGWTPLHFAAQNGHLEICRLITQHLEDKNPRNVVNGLTPLHRAAQNGHLEICRLIAQNLEDKNPLTNSGRTPQQLMNAYIEGLKKDAHDNDYIEDLKKNANDLFQ